MLAPCPAAPQEPPCPICHPAPCQPHCPVFPMPHGLTALWPHAPASTSPWSQSPLHTCPHSSHSHPRCPAPSAASSAGGALPHSHPTGTLAPGGSSVPLHSAWHVGPASWHVPHPWGDTPGAGILAAGSPRIGDRLIKCVILNYPDKSIRAFKVNSLNIIMKRAFLCSR